MALSIQIHIYIYIHTPIYLFAEPVICEIPTQRPRIGRDRSVDTKPLAAAGVQALPAKHEYGFTLRV